MLITIDLNRGLVTSAGETESREYPIGTPEAFEVISRAWLRSGWDNKHVYSFTWMGRPIIQLPEDLIRLQEVIYRVKPDVIVETGVAHGGSLVFYASLFEAMGKGRVIGIDIEIRPHNRAALESHEMFGRIELVEGSSTDPRIVEQVRGRIAPGETVLVLLDSNHTKAHVAAELEAYAPLVTAGSYIVATDGIMGIVVGGERTRPEWAWDNPKEAAAEFARAHPEFVLEAPAFAFNEGRITDAVTYWPGAWLRRR